MSRAENAIIMAAGTSSRFVPLSYEMPKGLLKVKGEVLIERQIAQLQAAGISDITVVVGYLKEKFYYLKEKYNVSIVENKDYYRYNNTSTLMCVLDKLSSTYVCSSDNYFTENVFETEVKDAYYAAVYSDGATEEWCLQTDDDGKIMRVTIGGRDAWYMLGHVYFSPEFSDKFKKILKKEYEREETRCQLWESVFSRHTEELPMYLKKYDKSLIEEFDSLEELREFDETYRDNSGSQIMRLLVNRFCCTESDITEFAEMKGGLTNQSFSFNCRGIKYVFRNPGEGTEKLINRKDEKVSTVLAESLLIDAPLIYFDAETGIKISRYIEDAETMTFSKLLEEENLKLVAKLLHKLHSCGQNTGVTFHVFEIAAGYEQFISEHRIALYDDYEEIKGKIYQLKEEIDKMQIEYVPCHNDPLCANWVRGGTRLYLVDWEYAGMNDPMWDVADVALETDMPKETEEWFLQAYFGRKPTEMEWKRYTVNKLFIDYLWTLWGKTRVPFAGEGMETYAMERWIRLKKNMENKKTI